MYYYLELFAVISGLIEELKDACLSLYSVLLLELNVHCTLRINIISCLEILR